MLRQVPFYENTDETHCFQAVMKMVAEFFWPEEEYSWDELDQITGKEDGEESIKHSNVALEIKRAQQAINQLKIHQSLPSQQSIKNYLEKGYLVICNVNANQLNQKAGYVGHFVLVVGFDDDELIFHDPGKPPRPFRKVYSTDFELAWGGHKGQMKNLVAIRRV